MSAKFSNRYAFFGTLDGVGFKELLERGVKVDDLPADDTELREAFSAAKTAYEAYANATDKLMATARDSRAPSEVRSPWHGRAQST